MAISEIRLDRGQRRPVSELVDPGAPTVSAGSRLAIALEALTETALSWVPVLDSDQRVVGTLSISDLVRAYHRELLANVERIGGLNSATGAFEVTITDDSPAVGKPLRLVGLPKGVLVTAITRKGDVVVPSGDTQLLAGDRLSLLGQHSGMERIGQSAPLASAS